MLVISKVADLNLLAQGSQTYWSFSYSKDSPMEVTDSGTKWHIFLLSTSKKDYDILVLTFPFLQNITLRNFIFLKMLQKQWNTNLMGLYHPLDGITNLEYKLMYFLTPIKKKIPRERH